MSAPQYIIALDYGAARIGVAIASSIARLPRPLTTLASNEQSFSAIAELLQQERAGLVVVGLPRTLDGGYSKQTYAAEAFARELAEHISVVMADETLTSVDAEAELAGKKHDKGAIDALAASYILERYLAEHSTEELQA
jgi:putative Holliday junction resolvase